MVDPETVPGLGHLPWSGHVGIFASFVAVGKPPQVDETGLAA
jgi:hypothetical protein